jgi:hypothetical protein
MLADLPEIGHVARAKALAPVRVVHHRVDALRQGFRVHLSVRAREKLFERGKIARVHGRASITDEKGDDWQLTVPFRGDGLIWDLKREDHVRIRIDPKAAGGHKEFVPKTEWVEKGQRYNVEQKRFEPAIIERETGELDCVETPGWTIDMIWAAQYLASHDLADVIEEGRAIARRFGELIEDRLRRIDLCADVAGFVIRPDDYTNFSRKAHVKVFPYTDKPEGDDGFRKVEMQIQEKDLPALADLYASGKIAGIRVGCGDAQAVVYDKVKELTEKGGGGKREAEHMRWTYGGWNGADPVTRCEFRIMGAVLDEMAMRDTEFLDEKTGELVPIHERISRMWKTFLRWLRLTEPGFARSGKPLPMARRQTDPRWRVLEAIDWTKGACEFCRAKEIMSCVEHDRPIRRVRLRGGASASQSLGSMASMVAASGALKNARGFPLPEHEAAYKEDPGAKLRAMLAIVSRFGMSAIEHAMIERWGTEQAAAMHVAIILNAARARFPRAGPLERKDFKDEMDLAWYDAIGLVKLPFQLQHPN